MGVERVTGRLKNSKGQFVIEAALLMVVTVSLFMWGTNKLRDGKYLAKLIGGPWKKVAGMLEAGVWEPPERAKKLHPNQVKRGISVDPN